MGIWSAFVSRIPLRLLASGTPSIGDVVAATSATSAAWTSPGGGGGPATQLDTTGAAVDVSGSAPPSAGDVLTATDATHATWQAPSGGPGGGGNGVDVVVAFGSSFTEYASTVVTGETWVTGTSQIVVTPSATAAEAQDVLLHGFTFAISDLVAGVGFTLHVRASAEAKGNYTFHCVGV